MAVLIEDNGIGMDLSHKRQIEENGQIKPTGHLGLRNVQDRLWSYYKNRGELQIDSDSSGTRITLLIPKDAVRSEEVDS